VISSLHALRPRRTRFFTFSREELGKKGEELGCTLCDARAISQRKKREKEMGPFSPPSDKKSCEGEGEPDGLASLFLYAWP